MLLQPTFLPLPILVIHSCLERVDPIADNFRLRYRSPLPLTDRPLCCNFNAQIQEEIILDDGAEQSRAFVIGGRLESGAELPSVRIPAGWFSGMTWVTESWGMRAVVRAGMGAKDLLREAIQRLSPEARQRNVFTHTGWRKIDRQWIYLSGNTTTGQGYEVDLGTELVRYRLPTIIDDEIGAMKASLELLKLAPLTITAPLLAVTYRAPLVAALPQDLSIWVEGKSGSTKSTLVALFASHFGTFDRTQLPGTWASTANQLERRAFVLKDTLFPIDDYIPTAHNQREMELKASRLLRAQGNLSGRGRLKSDLTERPAFYPRGIIISTGEQHPPGESLLARTLVIELKRDEVNLELLTELQQQSAKLRHAMAGYIRWLAPQMDAMPALLHESFIAARKGATGGAEHLRIPEAAAHLWVGLHCLTTYAQEIGAIDKDAAAQIENDCWNAFLEVGKEQARVVLAQDPVQRFFTVLVSILEQGRAVLIEKDDTLPDAKPGADFIGWYDSEWLYLIPEATFAAVARSCRESNEPFAMPLERLKKELANRAMSQVSPGHLTTTTRIRNAFKRVLKLNIAQVESTIGVTGVTGRDRFWTGERDGL